MITALVAAAWLHAATVAPLPQVSVQRLQLPKPIPDVEVIDHEGRKHRFYSDLIRGKTVVVNAVYTRCQSVCPLLGKTFRDLETALGDRLGRDVYLISISRDPENDTPEDLAAWRKKYGAKPGWIFVTGDKKSIDSVLTVLTGDPAFTGMHSGIAVLGNDATGVWVRDSGSATPEHYQRLLQYLAHSQ